jgi:hypothetical protein
VIERTYRFGVSTGLFEHCMIIGDAVWYLLWSIDRTTEEKDGDGKVLGGMPIHDSRPAEELGVSVWTIRRWRNKLTKAGYIKTTRTPNGHSVTVAKSKKWVDKDGVPRNKGVARNTTLLEKGVGGSHIRVGESPMRVGDSQSRVGESPTPIRQDRDKTGTRKKVNSEKPPLPSGSENQNSGQGAACPLSGRPTRSPRPQHREFWPMLRVEFPEFISSSKQKLDVEAVLGRYERQECLQSAIEVLSRVNFENDFEAGHAGDKLAANLESEIEAARIRREKAAAKEREINEIRARFLAESARDREVLEAELAAQAEDRAQTMREFGLGLPETVPELDKDSVPRVRTNAAVL